MWVDFILDLIYPPRCIFCTSIIPIEKEKGICEECRKNLSFIKGKVCKKCGKPLEESLSKEVCSDCKENPPGYEKGQAVFIYEGLVKDMIYRFKYGGHREYAKYLGKLMAIQIKEEGIRGDIDLIIPVPIHSGRKKKRGYNQCEELAKVISKELNIPMETSILIRAKETRPQSGLSTIQRKNNMKNAFKLNDNLDICHKNILLIDDIYTTGATINSCSKLLRKKKINKVYFSTLCIGHDFS